MGQLGSWSAMPTGQWHKALAIPWPGATGCIKGCPNSSEYAAARRQAPRQAAWQQSSTGHRPLARGSVLTMALGLLARMKSYTRHACIDWRVAGRCQ